MATLTEKRKIEDKKSPAGTFLCDSSENFYWMQKHLERFKEAADDNGQVLQVVAFYVPKPVA